MEQELSTVEPIRVGVIGAGVMSTSTHLPMIQRLKEEGLYELVIVCDLNNDAAKRARENFEFAHHTHDVEELFSSNITALYVIGSVEMHYQYAARALQQGLHVFIEKPPAPSYDDFKNLIALAKEAGVVSAVGLNRRFQKNIRQIKDESMATGLYAMEATFHKPVAEREPPFGAKTWLPINAIHSIDVLLYMKGELPISINTAHNNVRGNKAQNFSALLTWKDGTHALLAADNSAGARVERYVFHGYGVSYTVDPCFTRAQNGEREIINDGSTFEYRGFYEEHKEFADAIIEGRQAEHRFENCSMTICLTQLIEQGYSGLVDPVTILDDSVPVRQNTLQSTNKEAVLVLNPDGLKQHLPSLRKQYEIVYADSMTDAQRKCVVGLITGPGGGLMTDSLISSLPQLRVAGIVGASLKSYNTDALFNNQIPIFNASDAYADSVAEFIVMQAIAGVREAVRSHDIMRNGGWGIASTKPSAFMLSKAIEIISMGFLKPVKDLLRPIWKQVTKSGAVANPSSKRPALQNDFRGSTFGIVGFGAITRKLIPYLHFFDCEIFVFSEHLSNEEAKDLGVKNATMPEVLQCQIVSMQRGYSERTKNSFGTTEFSAMKKGSLFINAGRAGVVDENAMVQELKQGRIFACLDVFHQEPLKRNHVLRKLSNVFLTSHIAACSTQMRNESVSTVVRKVTDYLSGKEIEDVVVDEALLKNMT